MRDVNFEELIGLHKLTGVDRENEEVKTWGDTWENCCVLRFVLDGKTYTATEDPNDGYRSSCRSFTESEGDVKNKFKACKVMGLYKEREGYNTCSILELYDTTTGKAVIRVGTDNSNDYYPSFVAEFNPENMASNAELGKEPK